MDGFEVAVAYVRITPDTDGFAEELKAQVEEATAGAEGKVKVGADDAELDAVLDDAKAKLDELDGKDATVSLRANDGDLSAKADDATARLREIGDTEATAKLRLDKGDFDEPADDATAKLEEFDGKEAAARLGLDKGEWDAGIAEADAQLDALKAKASSIRLGSTGGISGGGGGESGGEGSLLGAIGLIGGGLLPGVGGAAAGLGLLGATGGLAFGGIAKALSAAHQSSTSTGLTSAQVAEQNFSNAVQITQANEQIQQSQMNLAEVTRNAAASQVQALQSVTQAQQQVQQATYGLSQANYNLSQAYVQARENITQLNDQLADSKLSVQSASLAVQQAQYQETQVNQDAYSTDLDRQQAALAVAQAKQQLTDATDQEGNAQTAANLANSQGVDGSQTVIQAKQAQKAAQDSLTNASNSYADAQTNLTNTELNNASQVKQAQMQVADAQQNLTNTIKEQQLQWAATQSTANSAANQFAKYMAGLSPAGRAFVNQVLGMRGAFKGLEADAQTATLPGFTKFLQGTAKLAPEISSGITLMGGAISKAFARMGTEMQTPKAVTVLNGLVTNGMTFANTVLPAIGRAFGAVFDLGSSKGAATGLSNLIGGIFDGVAGFAKGLKPYIPDLNDFLTVAGKIAKALGPALAQDIGGIAKALDPLAKLLNSKWGGPFISAFAQIGAGLLMTKGLAKLLPGQLGEYFGAIPGKVLDLAVTPLKGMFAGLAAESAESTEEAGASFSTFLAGMGSKLAESAAATGAWIAEHAIAAGTFIAENTAMAASATVAFIAENAATLGLVAGIGLLVGAAVYLGTHWRQVWSDVKHWAEDAWHFIYDGFGKYLLPMLGPVGWIALGVIELSKHWKQIWGDIKTAASDAWTWIKDGAHDFVSAISSTWSKLESVFETPVNFLIKTVYDNGIAKLWNNVVGAVGLSSLKLPVISGLAGGGVLPGYAPGHDTVPALLSPGEAVLTPGATRAIGGAPVVNALNAAHAPAAGNGGPGRYSLGGIVSGLLSGAEGTAKAVTALATGNTTAFVNALAPSIGTSAAGTLGQVMVALPKTLLTDAAKAAMGMLGGRSGASGGGSLTAQVASWFAAAVKAAGVPVSWIPGLEQIAQHESSYNPRAVNSTAAGIAAGTPEGIMQTVLGTFQQYHVPGTSLSIFDPVANIAAAARYIQYDYGNPGNTPGLMAVSQGQKYTGYDSGGMLPTGMTAAVNLTGRPEAVLTPDESVALRTVARQMAAGGGTGGTGGAPTVTQIWNGPQMPSQETLAEMERHLSLLLG